MKAITLLQRKPIPSLIQSFVLVDDIEIILSEVMPNSTLDMHHHKQVQIGIGLRGNLDFTIEEDCYDLCKENVYIIGSDVSHGGVNKRNEPFIGIDIKLPAKNDVSSVFDANFVPMDSTEYHRKIYSFDGLPISVHWIKARKTHLHENSGVHIYLSGPHSVFDSRSIYHYRRGDLVNATNTDFEYIHIQLES